MNCDEIMEVITDYILNRMLGKAAEKPDEAVLRHLSSCAVCTQQVDVLMRIATEKNFRLSNPPSCDEVCERVPEMVETDRRLVSALFPAEWLHLKSCPECSETYEETRACLTREDEAEFEKVFESALRSPEPEPGIWESLSPYVQKLSIELNILVGRGKDALSRIPEWLGSATLVPEPVRDYRGDELFTDHIADVFLVPEPVRDYRGDDESREYRQILTIPDAPHKRQIIIETRPETEERIHLGVKLMDTETSTAISGVAISLLDAKGRFLAQLVTPEASDRKGLVEFPNYSPGNYHVKITESQMSWELSLCLG